MPDSKTRNKECIVIHENFGKKEYFIAPYDEDYGLLGFEPISYFLPFPIRPRPGFENGLVKTKQDLIRLHYSEYVDVTNTPLVKAALNKWN